MSELTVNEKMSIYGGCYGECIHFPFPRPFPNPEDPLPIGRILKPWEIYV